MAGPLPASPARSESVHAVRRIHFLGHAVAVVLQNANGPCPLIAITNALLLLRRIALADHFAFVDQSWMVEAVAGFISRTSRGGSDAALAANLHLLVRDACAALPRLSRGLDLNLHFADAESFEFTPELSVFDLCGVRLFHGWVVDPADAAAAAVAPLSVNQALNLIVRSRERPLTPSALHAAQSAAPDAGGAVAAALSPSSAPSATAALASATAGDVAVGSAAVASAGDDAGSAASASAGPVGSMRLVRAASSPHLADAGAGAGTGVASASEAPAPAPPLSADEFESALIVDQWMRDNGSQLTAPGLRQITERLVEREVALMFRGNHFATIFRINGQVLALVTDEGFRDVPEVVWETMDVHGDTRFVGADFRPAATPASQVAAMPTAAAAALPPPPALVIPAGVEVPPGFEALPRAEQAELLAVLVSSHHEVGGASAAPATAPASVAAVPHTTAIRGGGSAMAAAAAPPPPATMSSDAEMALRMQQEEMRVQALEDEGYVVDAAGRVVGKRGDGEGEGEGEGEGGGGAGCLIC